MSGPEYTITPDGAIGLLRILVESQSDHVERIRLLSFGYGWQFTAATSPGARTPHIPAWKLPIAAEVPPR